MYLTFAFLAAPLLFFMLVWVAVTAYRIYFPEKSIPFNRDPVVQRWWVGAAERGIPVGVREIREDQRERHRATTPMPSYHYANGYSLEGLPEDWIEDLHLRRN